MSSPHLHKPFCSPVFLKAMDKLFMGLTVHEPDRKFGYRIVGLKDEDQGRIFRAPRRHLQLVKPLGKPELEIPTTGKFVAMAIDPRTQKLILAYKEFPEGGGESVMLGALMYDEREYDKGSRQIIDFLTNGVVPVADNEYA